MLGCDLVDGRTSSPSEDSRPTAQIAKKISFMETEEELKAIIWQLMYVDVFLSSNKHTSTVQKHLALACLEGDKIWPLLRCDFSAGECDPARWHVQASVHLSLAGMDIAMVAAFRNKMNGS